MRSESLRQGGSKQGRSPAGDHVMPAAITWSPHLRATPRPFFKHASKAGCIGPPAHRPLEGRALPTGSRAPRQLACRALLSVEPDACGNLAVRMSPCREALYVSGVVVSAGCREAGRHLLHSQVQPCAHDTSNSAGVTQGYTRQGCILSIFSRVGARTDALQA